MSDRTRLIVIVPAIAASIFLAAPSQAALTCAREVMTEQGPVIGQAHKELPVCEYKGIPYSAQPVGQLRWKAPRPAAERDSALKAFQFGHRCISGGAGSGVPKRKLPDPGEDCLNLNIWRPQKSGVFPVMVWIHGGSLTTGTAAEPIYLGHNLAAEKDVVVVTINYRLNFYGFLAHPALSEEDPNDSSGNYGLLDQVAALQWVQDNIAAFSGDPDNVTIFGESAGGWSVCNLLACPLAKGLFHKAILESGGCDTVKSLEDGFEDGREFARKLGCRDVRDPAACMRGLEPEEIARALEAAKKDREKDEEDGGFIKGMLDFKWAPHVDGHVLETAPIEALRSGEFNRVPFMVGSNRDEAKLFIATIPGIRLAPPCLVTRAVEEVVGEDSIDLFTELYPYRDYRRPADAAIDGFGHMALGCKCFEAAEAVSRYERTYYYRFDYDDHLLPHVVGAAHGLEIPFVFGNLDQPPATWFLTKSKTRRAEELSRMMMEYWTNFAKTGDPNSEGLPEWPEYRTDSRNRMHLDLPAYAATATNVDQCAFWREHGLSLTGG